jgi:GrpB-like predicted nucleotidyltransferase (UPF0157 family)
MKYPGENVMLGLKRSEVKLVDHNPEWETYATQIIEKLWGVFGSMAVDIQHVGSTAIRNIKAKPDMYIIAGIKNMNEAIEILPRLQEIGITKISNSLEPDTMLCVLSDDLERDMYTLYVHIVPHGCDTWNSNTRFRDYMNAFPQKAAEYERLKISLAEHYPKERRAYKNEKIKFFNEIVASTHFAEWNATKK